MKIKSQNKLDRTKQVLSNMINKEVNTRIRGEKLITFSFEGKDEEAANKIVDYFSDKATVLKINKNFYDRDSKRSYIYMNFNKRFVTF